MLAGENTKDKVPPRSSSAWKTPLFDQYWAIKDATPGALLFFRLGDFYELFGEDAVQAAPLLEVQLTSRNKGQKEAIPMCGVPAHAIDSYAEKLLSKGHKVALCEQVSEAGKSKLVDREVVRILTPGLPTDFSRLSAKEPHWFYSFGKSESALSVVVYEFLAGKLFEGEVKNPEDLEEMLKKLRPQEILVSESLLLDKALKKNWKILTEDSELYSKLTPWVGKSALENLKEYLQYTQRFDAEELKEFLPDARSLFEILPSGQGDYARLPASVLEQWNIFPELFQLLDQCGSAVGSRKLREILSTPLAKASRIQLRQSVLQSFDAFTEFLEESKQVYDFERILGRFRVGAAHAQELLRFQSALEHAVKAVSLVEFKSSGWSQFFASEGLESLENSLQELLKLKAKLDRALEIPSDALRAGDLHTLIRSGYDPDFDALQKINETAAQWLAAYEERLRKEIAVPTLKVRYNRVFGYYIEITKSHLAKVPAGFQRKQTTVGGERFTTDELSNKESEILSAAQKVEARAREILEALQADVLLLSPELQNFIAHFSWMDAFSGVQKALKKLRINGPWTWPKLFDAAEFSLDIVEGRHPILSASNRDFVPNSVALGGDKRHLLLLTGPNMAGKSTLMRQTGLCLLLAQCGFPVPAQELRATPASGFYSRMGASDRILAGESTFMVEMKECAQILRDADAMSLLLIDEIGRGTSTRDGLAIARAVLRHIHNVIMAPAIFATHYHELSEDVLALPRAENASMSIEEWKGRLVFLRKLVFQAAESSYGIYVAKLAGLPSNLLKSAQKFFEDAGSIGTEEQLGLFAAFAPGESRPAQSANNEWEALLAFVGEIAERDPIELSPREAWTLLDEWNERARELVDVTVVEMPTPEAQA